MKLEILTMNGWGIFDATAVEGDAPNTYIVYVPVRAGISVKYLDGKKLRIDGVESVHVWGSDLSGGTLTLQVQTDE